MENNFTADIKETVEKAQEVAAEVAENAKKEVEKTSTRAKKAAADTTEKAKKVSSRAKKAAAETTEKAKKAAADTTEKAKKAAAETTEKAKKVAEETSDAVLKTATKLALTETYIQVLGREYKESEILSKIEAAYKESGHRVSSVKALQVYIKPEDGFAYYVINNKYTGKVAL